MVFSYGFVLDINNGMLIQYGITQMLQNPQRQMLPIAYSKSLVGISNDVGSAIINTSCGGTLTYLNIYGERVGTITNVIKFSWITCGY